MPSLELGEKAAFESPRLLRARVPGDLQVTRVFELPDGPTAPVSGRLAAAVSKVRADAAAERCSGAGGSRFAKVENVAAGHPLRVKVLWRYRGIFPFERTRRTDGQEFRSIKCLTDHRVDSR